MSRRRPRLDPLQHGALFQAILNRIEEGIVLVDDKGLIAWCNSQAARLLDVAEDELVGTRLQPIRDMMVEESDGVFVQEKVGNPPSTLMLKGPSTISPEYLAGRSSSTDSRQPLHLYSVFDITDWTRLRRDAAHYATHDPLTGFASRSILIDYVNRAVARAERLNSSFAALMIDLDRFHLINDTYSHAEGDRVLVEMGTRIQNACSPEELILRLGNDVFLVLLERLNERSEAAILAEQLLSAINRPLQVDMDFVKLTASCGISVWPDDSRDGATTVSNAELALRKIKPRGGDYQFFSSELEAVARQERMVRQELRSAVMAGEFALHFQPQISLENGEVKGFEALIRWPRANREMIAPSIFIPIAESAGLIETMTDWVARTAIRHGRCWKQAGLGDLGMSINVSARHFTHANLAEDMARVLGEMNDVDVDLTVEVTESILMSEPRRAVAILERLKQMGIKIAIDDFGTGYSSLAYLQEFPIDSLKIDRMFISQIGMDRKQNEIVAAIAHLAQNLGIRIVAEGVETVAQATFLAELGCEVAQGFLYSRPVPADSVPSVLAGLKQYRNDTSALH